MLNSREMSKKYIQNFFRNIFLGILGFFLTLIIVIGAFLFYTILQLPDISQLKDIHLQVPLRVYTADNRLIAEFGEKRRIPVGLQQVPKPLIKAILDTEDQRFYEHPGVDFIGIARAAKNLIMTGEKTQGASTIPMQVARNFFLSRKKSYTRKFKEILLAMEIDYKLSKDKILELYLNKVYFGQRAYGVASAAQVYYGKTLDELTLPEIAMIAGLPQAPSRDNPVTNPGRAIIRRNHVLERMLANQDIDLETYQQAIQTPISAKYHELLPAVKAAYVAEMARQLMVNRFGDFAYEGGFKVYTTIDSNLQQAANQTLSNGLLAYSKRHGYIGPEINLGHLPKDNDLSVWQAQLKKIPTINNLQPAAVTGVSDQSITALLDDGAIVIIDWQGLRWARARNGDLIVGSEPEYAKDIVKVGDVIRVQNEKGKWKLEQVPRASGALVAMDPNNGAVLALNGGFSYQQNNFNCATQADRQVGSIFKPFVYSAALAKGFTLASTINDAPIVMQDSGENMLWRPQNVNKQFYGPTRLRIGLIRSRNLVSIRLLQTIGVPYAIAYIQKFGFDSQKLPHTLSLALGTANISPIDLTAGYAVFANGGYRINPFFIDHIEDENGKTIYQAEPLIADSPAITNSASRVISKQNAYLITAAMQDVIRRGTGRGALVLKRSDLSGKTGTTNGQQDAWFSGFNSDIVATVWIGFPQPTTLKEYGAQAALPVWIDFMQQALQGKPEHSMQRPAEIISVRIDPATGLLAYSGQKNAIFELFRKQYVPQDRAENPNPVNESVGNTVENNQLNVNNNNNNNDGELF